MFVKIYIHTLLKIIKELISSLKTFEYLDISFGVES